jgi:acyl-CoA thioester hydrolase
MDDDRSAELILTIPFHDVDPMNIVWHGRYVKYFELVRCQLLETFEYSYADMFTSGYSWPVVDMRIKYVKPATFSQRIKITATLKEWEYRLKITYLVEDAQTGEKLTKGFTIQVAVDLESGEMCNPSPAILWQKLGIAKP